MIDEFPEESREIEEAKIKPRAGRLDKVKLARAIAEGCNYEEAARYAGSRAVTTSGATAHISNLLKRDSELRAMVATHKANRLHKNAQLHEIISDDLLNDPEQIARMSPKDKLSALVALNGDMLALSKESKDESENDGSRIMKIEKMLVMYASGTPTIQEAKE